MRGLCSGMVDGDGADEGGGADGGWAGGAARSRRGFSPPSCVCTAGGSSQSQLRCAGFAMPVSGASGAVGLGVEALHFGLDPVFDFHHQLLVLAAHGRRSEEHTSELQSQSNLVCRLLLEKKKYKSIT